MTASAGRPVADDSPASRQPLRIALAGLGTVGTGVLRLIAANRAIIERRAGRPVEVVAVSARDRTRDRGIDLGPFRFEPDAVRLAEDPSVDVIVEVMGGADGAALALARAAIARRKAVVTANKAMIAHHGLSLARAAEAADVPLKYEAAVAGGIPVIKALREGASANRIARVYGILNGTCNFILTRMEDTGADFAAVLGEAQAKGFAEADPAFDIDGIDAGHKLSILASLCFGTRLDFGAVHRTGIRRVIAADIAEARALGHRVRLLGWAELDPDTGALHQEVRPFLVPEAHPLAYVPGSINAVVAEGNFVGRLFFEGAGAGAGPTASAIVADIIDIARDEYGPAFAMPVDALDAAPVADAGARVGKHYLRLVVADRVGVLAEVAATLRDADVSVESFIQRGTHPGGGMPAIAGREDPQGDAATDAGDRAGVVMVLVTHDCAAAAIDAACRRLAMLEAVRQPPMRMPILAL